MANKKDDGYWFSLENGTHIHVGKGETPEEATQKFLNKKKKGSGVKDGYSKEDEFDADNDFENWPEDDAESFSADLQAAIEKHKGDENKVLDELRKNGKDYGMSNSDLQGAVELKAEKYRKENLNDDYDFAVIYDPDNDDWNQFAEETDKKVPQNWKSDGFDGDTRFYKVSDQKGVESASVSPDGVTTIYTKNGMVQFDSLEDAQSFLSIKDKDAAEEEIWAQTGSMTGNSEAALEDMFGNEVKNMPKIVNYEDKEQFLEDNNLSNDFYFDGGDLVDAKTGADTGIRVGMNGSQYDFLLKRINEYKNSSKNNANSDSKFHKAQSMKEDGDFMQNDNIMKSVDLGYYDDYDIVKVPIDKLSADNDLDNLYKNETRKGWAENDKYDETKDNHPTRVIEGIETDNGKIELNDGRHRVKALKDAGYKNIIMPVKRKGK